LLEVQFRERSKAWERQTARHGPRKGALRNVQDIRAEKVTPVHREGRRENALIGCC
jgi:hypothetical protein